MTFTISPSSAISKLSMKSTASSKRFANHAKFIDFYLQKKYNPLKTEHMFFASEERRKHMANQFKFGNHAFIVENGDRITEVTVGKCGNGFYRVVFLNSKTVLNLPEARLHKTREEAEKEKSAIKEEIAEHIRKEKHFLLRDLFVPRMIGSNDIK